MATVKGRDNKRYSRNGFFDDAMAFEMGELFVAPDGSEWDSRSVSVLHVGIDTLKQLYTGMVKLDRFQFIEDAYNAGVYTIELEGYVWKIGSARRGGYRYSLNNPDFGVLVLLGSFYTEPKYEGDHLKIELSPHFILNKNMDDLQGCVDEIADFFIHLRQYSNVAFHVCCDVQGWQPPDDLDRCLVTRAHRITKYSGETELTFEKHAIATVYGCGQTFTFGGAGSLQFSVYNKTKLISKNQNVQEYWHSVYSTKVNVPDLFIGDDFDPGKPVFQKDVDVYRLEARFHQSVVAQFALGLNEDLRSFKQLSKHLTGFWRYALGNFRLDASPTYIDPFWQFLRDDIVFNHDRNALEYKRIYKKTDFDSPPSDRVLKIVFGLLCSCYRRLKYDLDYAYQCLRGSGLFDCLEDLFIRQHDWDVEYCWDDARRDIRASLELKLFPLPPISCD